MPLPTHGAHSRRRFLAGLGGLGGAAAATMLMSRTFSPAVEDAAATMLPQASPVAPDPEALRALMGGERPARTAGAAAFRHVPGPNHLAWVWRFDADGRPEEIRDALAEHGLGVALKTHDGRYWMSRYDQSRHAIGGPAAVERFATFFERGGVPFHAWAVVKGRHPAREASIASDVLNAGARSLFLDLEAHEQFWVGTPAAAERFGEELRRRQPTARLSTSIDPRPWEIDRIPLREFAAFSDEIAPQTYWGLFSSSANVRRYRESGEALPGKGITPAFVLDVSMRRLAKFNLPIHPIGDGTVADTEHWSEFLRESQSAAVESISVWRYGVADPSIWSLLRDMPAGAIAK